MRSTTFHPMPSFLLACLFLLATASGALAQSALNLEGKAADPFRASPEQSLKPVVLVFVRTDCPISNRYAPLLERIEMDYRGKANFWLVYPDKQTNAKQIREHKREFGYRLPALRDPDHVLVKRASVSITPEAAVFDAHGKLLYHGRIDNWYEDAGRSRPAATSHELQSVLEAVISGKPSPVRTAPAVGCYITDLE